MEERKYSTGNFLVKFKAFSQKKIQGYVSRKCNNQAYEN